MSIAQLWWIRQKRSQSCCKMTTLEPTSEIGGVPVLTGAQELRWLHGLNGGSWASRILSEPLANRVQERFAVLRIDERGTHQSMHALQNIDATAALLQGLPECYVSQASFIGSSRQKAFFSRVRACWVDLDLHKDGMQLDSATVRDILVHCQALGLPAPTMIIASGRGAYLKWILKRPLTNLPAWNAAQAMLVLLFQRFLADKRARDACRVFRMLGTRNSKVEPGRNNIVHVVDGSGEEVDFEALAQALQAAQSQIDLPAQMERHRAKQEGVDRRRGPRSKTLSRMGQTLREAAERGSVEELRLYSAASQPIMMGPAKTGATLGWARFQDLRDLYIARGGIPVGQRDLVLFWMLNFLAQAGVVESSNWEREVKSLLAAFPQVGKDFDPLRDGSLSTLKRRMQATEALRAKLREGSLDPEALVDTDELLYRPSNRFLIDVFDITPEEQKSLRTIISAEERQRRRDEKAPGRAERRAARQALREKIARWLAEHNWVCSNISALARELGEGVAKVWRIVKSLLRQRAQECAQAAQATPPAASSQAPAASLRKKAQKKTEAKTAGPEPGRFWVKAKLFWVDSRPIETIKVALKKAQQKAKQRSQYLASAASRAFVRALLAYVRRHQRMPDPSTLAQMRARWWPQSLKASTTNVVRTQAEIERLEQRIQELMKQNRLKIQQAQENSKKRLLATIERTRKKIQQLCAHNQTERPPRKADERFAYCYVDV